VPFARRQGYWEAASTLFCRTYQGASTVVAVAEIHGFLDDAAVRAASKILWEVHPLLRASIVIAEDGLWFRETVAFPDVPISIEDHPDEPDGWMEIVDREVKDLLPIDRYLWRLTLLVGERGVSRIVLCFHHAICDGVSLLEFVEDLLALHERIRRGERVRAVAAPLLPPVEQLLDRQPAWGEYAKVQAEVKSIDFTRVDFHGYAPVGQRQTRNLYRRIEAPRCARLQAECQRHGTTVNAALNAAMLLSFQRLEGAVITGALTTPINLRRRCLPPVDASHMGCFVSTATTFHDEIGDTSSFWALARDYFEGLAQAFPRQALLPREFDLAAVMASFDTSASDEKRRFELGFGVSNMGSVAPLRRDGGPHLVSVRGCTSRESGDWVVLLNCITIDGAMFLTFSYTEPLLDESWAVSFVDSTMDRLVGTG